MSLLEIIPEDTKAKSLVVYYNDAEFATLNIKDIVLPIKKYEVVFKAVENLMSELDPMMKEIVNEEPAMKSVILAMSGMMSEDTISNFIEKDEVLQFFTVKERFKKSK